MITRQEFPYLQELVINDAYAVKNLRVPVFEPGQEFKHLVLTGRNGSGKTTVLRALDYVIDYDINNSRLAAQEAADIEQALLRNSIDQSTLDYAQKKLGRLVRITPSFKSHQANAAYSGFSQFSKKLISVFFEANRKIQVGEVSTVTREDELEKRLMSGASNNSSAEFFKQYLVNKKVFQVFDAMDGRVDGAKQQEVFFSQLEKNLAEIFNDPNTSLEFVREHFEFYINLSDGRRFTFNQLSAGFSAFLSILTELLMRVDLLRKRANDYNYDPCGFVLIDEPETHLHLEMQYQILPLLTNLFPNLQFIVATHSPAVASSIKNATVFDLSTGQALGDEAAGSSFSELMQTHFGLENEYSNVADKILEEVTEIGQMSDRAAALARLQHLLDEQGRYMSPVLRLDVQAQLLHLQREQAA
ncbi:AAA family ATPase [Hymenobacter rubidus]|uniref:AAA family ATPase n=1 Tax=Hymenobacter rubidus TaxID=1441626 RepID=UPI00191E07FC|nr:AAA family ATPase [Hymenobacter rubidus]